MYFIIEIIHNILYSTLTKVYQQSIKQDSTIIETIGIKISTHYSQRTTGIHVEYMLVLPARPVTNYETRV